MRKSKFIFYAAGLVCASCVQASDVQVPSGRSTALLEVFEDRQFEPIAMRFRFVQPAISDAPDFEGIASDLFALCQDVGLPDLGENAADYGQIVVSLADKESPFGETNPAVFQVFEVFSIVDGRCEWGEQFE